MKKKPDPVTPQKKLSEQAAAPLPDPTARYLQAASRAEQDDHPISHFRRRLSQFAGLSAVLAFMLVDLLAGGEAQATFTDWKLIALFLPFLLIPIALTFTHESRSDLTQYAFIGLFAVGLAMAGIAEVTQRHTSWFNQESFTLATIYIYFLSGLTFFRALFSGLSAWLAFGVSQLANTELSLVMQGSYYLLVANVVGASGLYCLEWHSRQKQQELVRLRSENLTDDVTRALNRKAVDAHLERLWRYAIRESRPLCVMRLNTDRFHDTCRQVGRDTGNRFLRHAADVLSSYARRPMDAVGRYGNDEFLVVWFDAQTTWLTTMLQVLSSRFSSFDAGMSGIGLSPFTLSGGAIQAWPAALGDEDLQSFMDKISAQLRRAKKAGGGRIIFSNLGDDPTTDQTVPKEFVAE